MVAILTAIKQTKQANSANFIESIRLSEIETALKVLITNTIGHSQISSNILSAFSLGNPLHTHSSLIIRSTSFIRINLYFSPSQKNISYILLKQTIYFAGYSFIHSIHPLNATLGGKRQSENTRENSIDLILHLSEYP
ncbi:uncharacterized protein EAF02_003969 [Botrytis sinoallii]|uniref:uncharacterized protein n=1 Tax=Botrytis sinoallii TaxID=1463999 RepID=UPI0018FF9510|nr:uncharacterized protein EAF02_003969 [Botrytis sinoallii]KAF7885460.1 hypothetical protein EAF02_003969 [Botrytis sinoallii]